MKRIKIPILGISALIFWLFTSCSEKSNPISTNGNQINISDSLIFSVEILENGFYNIKGNNLPKMELFIYENGVLASQFKNDSFPRTRHSFIWEKGLMAYQIGSEIWLSHLNDPNEKLIKTVYPQPNYAPPFYPVFAKGSTPFLLTENKILFLKDSNLIIMDTLGQEIQNLKMDDFYVPIIKIDSNWITLSNRNNGDLIVFDVEKNLIRYHSIPNSFWPFYINSYPGKIFIQTPDSIYVYDLTSDSFEDSKLYNLPESSTILYLDTNVIVEKKDSLYIRTNGNQRDTLFYDDKGKGEGPLTYKNDKLYFLQDTGIDIINILEADFSEKKVTQVTHFLKENTFIMDFQIDNLAMHFLL